MPTIEANKPVIYVAAAVLIQENGKILIAQRPKGKSMAGFWEFPGGKIKAGETPEQALIRELQEELGITCHISHMKPISFVSYDYGEFHLFMPLWLVTHWDGVLTPYEHQAVRWIKPCALENFPMPPADEPLTYMINQYFHMMEK